MGCRHYLIAIIRPAPELHFTVLIIEGEPCDVYFTSAFENTRRYIQATAVVFHHDVRMVSAIKSFISAKITELRIKYLIT